MSSVPARGPGGHFAKGKEVSRPPKGERMQPSESGELYKLRVTETQNMRNSGTSIVNEKINRLGYVKPEDPALLQASPDGNSFNLVKPKAEMLEARARNNRRAKAMEGFHSEREFVKSASNTDGSVTGAELEERALSDTSIPVEDHDG